MKNISHVALLYSVVAAVLAAAVVFAAAVGAAVLGGILAAVGSCCSCRCY